MLKMHSSVKFGTVHVFKLLQKTRRLSYKVRKIIYLVILSNVNFCHKKNLLILMVLDETTDHQFCSFKLQSASKLFEHLS